MVRLSSRLRPLIAAAALAGAALSGGALLVGTTSCATPTLPLPPPSALASPPDADGLVSLSGEALEGAFVLCLNERTERGLIVRADDLGAYAMRIEAEVGDLLTVWQQVGSDRGADVHVLVPPPR